MAKLISDQAEAQRGLLNPYTIATGKSGEARKAAIEATTKLSNIKDPISFTKLTERPDVLRGQRKDTEETVEQDAKKLEDEEKDIAGAGLGRRSIVMKNMGDNAPTMSAVSYKFSKDAQNDISLAGGTVSVEQNPNGTSYSKNADGSFTHEDGTTVNFPDSQGNPGNAPSPGNYSEPSYDTSSQDSAFSESFGQATDSFGGMFTAKGGFIKKPKPKVKNMKQGGLASRK